MLLRAASARTSRTRRTSSGRSVPSSSATAGLSTLSASTPRARNHVSRRPDWVAASTTPPVSSAHLGVELRLSFRDQRLGSVDQLEVDRDPALVDPGIEQEDLALSIGQRAQSLMERALHLDVLPAVGDQPRGPCPGRPTRRCCRPARSGAGAPSAASAGGRRCPSAPAGPAPWPLRPGFGAVPWRRQARRCSATARVPAPASRSGRQDMAPDHALERHRVVRNERMAGSHMLDQLSRRRIARTPGLNGAIADRPAGAP